MKKLLLTAFTLLGTLTLQAQDWGKLALKGEVSKAVVSSEEYYDYSLDFTSNGKATQFALESPDGPFTLRNVSATNSGFKGTCNGVTVTVTVSGGRITAANYTNGDGRKYALRYTYGSNGFLTKVTNTAQWTTTTHNYVQTNAKIDTQGAEKILQQMKQTNDPKRLAQLQQQYQEAVKKANVKVTGGYTKEQKQSHSTSESREFWGYKTDAYGNWTERSYTNSYGSTRTQKQTIQYNPTFLSRTQWEQLQRNGNLNDIEAFALNTDITNNYRQKASEYWNQHILTEADRDIDKLSKAASSKIVSESTKEQALGIIRERIYTEQVEPETNYKKLAELAYLKINDFTVFDEAYRTRILDRSQQLRTELLNEYQNQVQMAYDQKDYAGASMYAKKMLEVDPYNTFAKDIRQESDYAIIKNKELLGSVSESDYTYFLWNNHSSPHKQEIVDSRARLYTNKNLKPNITTGDIDLLRSEGADPKILKQLEHRVNHQNFVAKRGRFFRIGPDFDFSIGGGHTAVGAGLRAKLGYLLNYVNFSVGVKYQYLTCTSTLWKATKTLEGGYFDRRCITMPLEMRILLNRDAEDGAGYVGLGAELSFADLGTHYIYPDNNVNKVRIKDKELAKDGVVISPKFTLGCAFPDGEMELSVIYDQASFYDKERALFYDSESPIFEKAYKKQIKGDGLGSKLRFGLAIRVFF